MFYFDAFQVLFKMLAVFSTSVLVIAVMYCTEATGKPKKLVWPYNGSKRIFYTSNTIFEKVKSASIHFNKIIGVEMVGVLVSEDLKCSEKNQINEICVKPNLSQKNYYKKSNINGTGSLVEMKIKKDGFSSWSYHTTPYGVKKFECDIFLFSDNPKPLVIEHEMGHCVGFNHAPKGLMTATINAAKPFIYKPQFIQWNSVVVK